jgi:hypothetical protein
MTNVVRKRLGHCQKSLQRLSDIALWERKRKKEKVGQSDERKQAEPAGILSIPTG